MLSTTPSVIGGSINNLTELSHLLFSSNHPSPTPLLHRLGGYYAGATKLKWQRVSSRRSRALMRLAKCVYCVYLDGIINIDLGFIDDGGCQGQDKDWRFV